MKICQESLVGKGYADDPFTATKHAKLLLRSMRILKYLGGWQYLPTTEPSLSSSGEAGKWLGQADRFQSPVCGFHLTSGFVGVKGQNSLAND